MNSYEHFATKGIWKNLKAPRSLDEVGSYYPIATYENESQSAFKSILAVLLATTAVVAYFYILLSPLF